MEKTITRKALNDNLRNKYIALVRESLEQLEEEILVTASNEFAIPTVDEQGNDTFVVIKFTVPTGSRNGDAYDGYAVANEYAQHTAEMAEKKKAEAEARAKKKAKDAENRKKLAESKAKAKAEKEKAE